MTASLATRRAVMTILRRYLDKITLREILLQLRGVSGNQSFEETINLLYQMNEATP